MAENKMNIKEKQSMRQVSYLDDAIRTCPCGGTFTWSDMSSKELKEWVDRHREHTNGKLHHAVGGDWHRVYAERPEDYETDLI